MRISTEDPRPDVKLITAGSLDDAVFVTQSPGGKTHETLDCRALEGKDLVFGHSKETHEADCGYCS